MNLRNRCFHTHFQVTIDGNESNESYRNDSIETKTKTITPPKTIIQAKQITTTTKHPSNTNEEMFAVNSLWCLSNDNKFRICIQHIVSSKYFISAINIIIILNCIILICETIDKLKIISNYTNYIFTSIFTIECILKIIAHGFIIDQHSYLRNPWNWLDFLVVITGLLSFFPNISANLFALRLFRLLRPLKTISIFPNLRIFITTFINSLLDISIIFFIMLFFIIIFATFGLTLWYNTFEYRCRQYTSTTDGELLLDMKYYGHLCGGENTCDDHIDKCLSVMSLYRDNIYFLSESGEYNNELHIPEYNYGLTRFDNMLYSMLTVFQISSGEGWTKVMRILMDGHNYYVSLIYFVLCVIVNYYFMCNIVVAVLLYNFSKARQCDMYLHINEGNTTISEMNNIYKIDNLHIYTLKKKYQRQYTIIDTKLKKSKSKGKEICIKRICKKCKRIHIFDNIKPKSKYHKQCKCAFCCYFIYKQPLVQYVFYGCILLNCIILALERVDMSQTENNIIEKMNIVFVAIFSFEIVILIIGNGCKSFIHDYMSIFDLIIIVISLIEIILKAYGLLNINSSASIASVFRIMRILRVFKLFRSWKSFQIIMESILNTLYRMFNYIILFCLFIFVYALLGFSFFNSSLTKHHFYNFNTLPNSLICVFIIIIGDNWYELFYECYNNSKNSGAASIIYFITLVLFGQITLMNIFLAYLIYNFQTARKQIELNINVKRYIHYNIYHINDYDNIKEEKYRLSKRTIMKGNVVNFNFFLMKLQNQQLIYEEEIEIVSKTELDFTKNEKVKEEVYRVLKRRNVDECLWNKEEEEVKVRNEKVVVLNELLRKEEMNIIKERNMMDIEDDIYYYEFDFDYEEDNDIQMNKMKMKVNENDNEDDSNSDSIIEDYSNEISQITQSNNENNNKQNNSVNVNSVINNKETSIMKEKKYSQVDTLENLINRKPALICDDNSIITLTTKNKYNHIPNINTTKLLTQIPSPKNIPPTNIIKHPPSHSTSIHSSSNNIPSILYTSSSSHSSFNTTLPYESTFLHFIRTSSLFIFSNTNPLRIFLTKLTTHHIFNITIFILILLNCIFLSLDNLYINPSSAFAKTLRILNIIFTILFTIEFLFRVISSGFLFVKNAYLHNFYNIIDFICIIISFIDISSSSHNLHFLRTFRSLRSVKPIRLITRSQNLKLITTSLLTSLPSIGNLIVACFSFVFIFCLVGITLFKNDLHYYCDIHPTISKDDCLKKGGHWTFYNENYSNFLYAIKNVFILMMKEGWVDMMRSASIWKGTKWVEVYFVIVIIVGYMFIMKLIVAVVMQGFYIEKQKGKTFSMLIEPEREWIQLQQLMMKFHPVPKISMKSSMKWRGLLAKVVMSKIFDYIISSLIILSAIILMIQYNGCSKLYNDILELLTFIFTGLFNIELILKLIVYMKSFFHNTWNRFDFAVIILSDIIILLNILTYLNIINFFSLSSLPILLRLFHIFRLFRLLTSFNKLRALIDTLLYLIPSLGNITVIIIIILVIYGNIGMHIFGAVPYRDTITSTNNFRNFLSSALLLFQSTTGESWTSTMNELAYHNCKDPSSIEYNEDKYCYNYNITCNDDDITYNELISGTKYSCGSNISYIYFISYIIICPMFIMNLCIVMVIEGFSQSMYQNEGLLPQDYLDKFVSVWMEYDPECKMLIRPHEFVLILKQLPPPIGFNYDRHMLVDSFRFKRDYQQYLVFKALVNERNKKLLEKVKNEGKYIEKENEINNENDIDISVILNKCNKINLDENDFIVKILPHSYEFKNYYLSKNKKFHTNDIEVMKIVNKFGLLANYNKSSHKPKVNIKPLTKTYSYTISSQVENELPQECYVHFVDACLAMSRYVISKAENISFDALRKDVVDGYTRKMWVKEYPDQEVNKFFVSNHNLHKRNKSKQDTELLSKLLASRILMKVQKIFKQRLYKTRESLQRRKQQYDVHKFKPLTNINEEEENVNVNERRIRFYENVITIHNDIDNNNNRNQSRCYTENNNNNQRNIVNMYNTLSHNLIHNSSNNIYQCVFYNPSELLEVTERRHNSLGNMLSI